jgi:hypothetical protein
MHRCPHVSPDQDNERPLKANRCGAMHGRARVNFIHTTCIVQIDDARLMAPPENRHYTALYSNTPHGPEAGKTRDWVVIYQDGTATDARCTVITARIRV